MSDVKVMSSTVAVILAITWVVNNYKIRTNRVFFNRTKLIPNQIWVFQKPNRNEIKKCIPHVPNRQTDRQTDARCHSIINISLTTTIQVVHYHTQYTRGSTVNICLLTAVFGAYNKHLHVHLSPVIYTQKTWLYSAGPMMYIGCVVLFTGWFHRCIRLALQCSSLMHRWNQLVNKTTHPYSHCTSHTSKSCDLYTKSVVVQRWSDDVHTHIVPHIHPSPVIYTQNVWLPSAGPVTYILGPLRQVMICRFSNAMSSREFSTFGSSWNGLLGLNVPSVSVAS